LKKIPNTETLDVVCGELRGKLHREKFTCPGVNQKCIELENGKFVTPKEFKNQGGKMQSKQWKEVITIDNILIRYYRI
jgi:hypothetical protein